MTRRPSGSVDMLETQLDADFKAMLEQSGMLRSASNRPSSAPISADAPFPLEDELPSATARFTRRPAVVLKLDPAPPPRPQPPERPKVVEDPVEMEMDQDLGEILEDDLDPPEAEAEPEFETEPLAEPRRRRRASIAWSVASCLVGAISYLAMRAVRGLPVLIGYTRLTAGFLIRLARPASGTLGGDPVADSIRRHVRTGLIASLLLAGGVAGWAVLTSLSGAVIAMGHLAVDSSVKSVQHPTGGIVAALNVRDGDTVKAGDILIRLDDTSTRANLAMVTKAIDALEASRTRLLAERENATTIDFPESLRARASDPVMARILEDEQRHFSLRRDESEGQKAQLRERIDQLHQEADGLAAQSTAKADEIELLNKEVTGVRSLYQKKLVPISRLAELERALARLRGESGQLTATIAQAKGRVSETQLQILQIDQNRRSQVASELAEAENKLSELEERRISAQDQLRRIEIRAPQSGRVHQLAVHTVGGVIGAGQQVMQVVPSADVLVVDAQIAPQDIDQLHVGQPATVKLTALNQRTTPELEGEVRRISPDLLADEKSGGRYYGVQIAIADGSLKKVGSISLVPGMPIEAFIKTADRTVMSFLMKPFSDQVARAFREE